MPPNQYVGIYPSYANRAVRPRDHESEAAAMSLEKAARPLRADAQRNRDAILAAARETFTAEGALASLDGIALRAGVGNATLYRNFPNRFDLLAAIVPEAIGVALQDAEGLSRSLSPAEALREWLVLLTWQLRIWQDLPTCVATMTSGLEPVLEQTERMLAAAKAVGEARADVTAVEAFEIVTAVSWGVDRFGDDEATSRRKVLLSTAGFFTPPTVD
jgi:AcrR family transcriptional regulator